MGESFRFWLIPITALIFVSVILVGLIENKINTIMPNAEIELEEIKKKDPSIEVVMLTAYGYEDELINKSMQKGASGYISKNLPLQQIINTFNTLLKSMST